MPLFLFKIFLARLSVIATVSRKSITTGMFSASKTLPVHKQHSIYNQLSYKMTFILFLNKVKPIPLPSHWRERGSGPSPPPIVCPTYLHTFILCWHKTACTIALITYQWQAVRTLPRTSKILEMLSSNSSNSLLQASIECIFACK